MTGADRNDGVKGDPRRAWELLRSYVAQETVGPLKGAGRWLAVGIGAALVLAIGCCFVLLATLRASQDAIVRLDLHAAWGVAAYVVTIVAGIVMLAIAAGRIGKGSLS